MRSPLGPLASVDQTLLARRAAAATGVTFLIQFATGWALRLPEAPNGIVSLELAGSAERAEEILAAWEGAGLEGLATANVLLDFSFLVSYATLLVVLSVRAGARLGTGRWEAMGNTAGWGQWTAGGLDVAENVALLLMLAGAVSDPIAGFARAAAIGKFALIALGIVWIASAELVTVARRR